MKRNVDEAMKSSAQIQKHRVWKRTPSAPRTKKKLHDSCSRVGLGIIKHTKPRLSSLRDNSNTRENLSQAHISRIIALLDENLARRHHRLVPRLVLPTRILLAQPKIVLSTAIAVIALARAQSSHALAVLFLPVHHAASELERAENHGDAEGQGADGALGDDPADAFDFGALVAG